MTYANGYLTVGSWEEAPVRIHWTVPLAAFVLGFGHWAPVVWTAYALVLLTHAIGHVLVARRAGGTVDAIEVTGWGGQCRWSGDPTSFDAALVAGGGGLAQAALFVVIALLLVATAVSQNGFILELVGATAVVNLIVLLVNLIPIAPLDGARAWPLVLYGIALWRETRTRSGFTQRRMPTVARRRDHLRIVRLDERLERQLDQILKDARRPTSANERSNQDK